MPEMRTRTKMKNVASDRARRENVPRHILSYVYDEPLRTKIVSAKASTIFESHLHCTISELAPFLLDQLHVFSVFYGSLIFDSLQLN